MSPASKFWLGILIVFLIFLIAYNGLWLALILYLIWSLITGILYIGETEYNTEEENKEYRGRPWIRITLFFIIPWAIVKFNTFLNNKFNKNKPKL